MCIVIQIFILFREDTIFILITLEAELKIRPVDYHSNHSAGKSAGTAKHNLLKVESFTLY